MVLDIWTEPDNDEPDDDWIAMDDSTYTVELFVALHNTGNQRED